MSVLTGEKRTNVSHARSLKSEMVALTFSYLANNPVLPEPVGVDGEDRPAVELDYYDQLMQDLASIV